MARLKGCDRVSSRPIGPILGDLAMPFHCRGCHDGAALQGEADGMPQVEAGVAIHAAAEIVIVHEAYVL